MEAILLNSNLEIIGFLDIFKSFLWSDKYDKYGEFELVDYPSQSVLSKLMGSSYVLTKESEHAMVIDSINIHSDPVNGNEIIVKGKSLESILNRRVILNHTTLSGNFQTAIQTLLTENAINPTNISRKIDRLEFLASTDPIITALTIDNEFLGENLYDVISSLCIANQVGFKITLTSLGKFQFQLYAGVDRSYDQIINSYVVFSPDFDNLVNGDYFITDQYSKNVALVAGEKGVENVRTFTTVEYPVGVTDLERREIFVDAGSITRNTSAGTLTEPQYLSKLEDRGYEELAANTSIQTFDGQLESTGTYVYGEDFNMGDIVQVSNEYGHESTSRVTEIIYFQDPAGFKITPTFVTI